MRGMDTGDRKEEQAMDKRRPLSGRDNIILASGMATVFIAGIVQLILPLAGIYSAWPTGITLALNGAFLATLNWIKWKQGFLSRKLWRCLAMTVAWGIWLVAVTGWLTYEVF